MMMDCRTPTSAKMATPTPTYLNSTASSIARVCEMRKMIATLHPTKVLGKIPRKSCITTPTIPTSPVTIKPTPSYHVPTTSFATKIKKPKVVVEKRMIVTLHSPAIQRAMYSKSSYLMKKGKESMLTITSTQSQTMSAPNVNSSAISLEKSVLMASTGTPLEPFKTREMMAEAPREEKTTVSSVQSGFFQVDVHRKKNEKMFKASTHHQMMSGQHSSKNSFFTGKESKVSVMTSIRGKIRMKKTPSAVNIITRKKLVGKGVLVPCSMYKSPSTGNHEKKSEPPDNILDYQVALEKLHALLDTNPINLALSESMKKDQVIYELRSTCAELGQELASHRALNEINQGKLESHTRIELEKLALADEESKKKDAEIS